MFWSSIKLTYKFRRKSLSKHLFFQNLQFKIHLANTCMQVRDQIENDPHQVVRQKNVLFLCKIQLVRCMLCKGHLAIQAWNLFLKANDGCPFFCMCQYLWHGSMAAISIFENVPKVPAPSCTTICPTPVPWWRSTAGWSSSSRMRRPSPCPRTSSSSLRATSTSSWGQPAPPWSNSSMEARFPRKDKKLAPNSG